MQKASFIQRVIARVIDLIIVGIIAAILSGPLGGGVLWEFSSSTARLMPPEMATFQFGAFVFLFIVTFCLLYYPIAEYNGKRIGKNLVGIKTVKIGENRISLGRSYLRAILQLLAVFGIYMIVMSNFASFDVFVIVFLVYILISNFGLLFGNSDTNFQDRISGSMVIRK